MDSLQKPQISKQHAQEQHAQKHETHEEELPEQPSKLKKLFIIMGGLCLILLMLSFTFVSFPISDIIRGQLESNPLKDNIIQLENFAIIFENNTLEELQQIYFTEQKNEFSVCLSGNKENQEYHINSLYQPEMYEQSFNHVTFQPCSQDTLIMLHSHPYKSCLASDTDLNTLKQTQLNNPDVLMVIMCQPDRFSIYN